MSEGSILSTRAIFVVVYQEKKCRWRKRKKKEKQRCRRRQTPAAVASKDARGAIRPVRRARSRSTLYAVKSFPFSSLASGRPAHQPSKPSTNGWRSSPLGACLSLSVARASRSSRCNKVTNRENSLLGKYTHDNTFLQPKPHQPLLPTLMNAQLRRRRSKADLDPT